MGGCSNLPDSFWEVVLDLLVSAVTLLILSVVSNSSKYDMIVNIFLVVLLVSMVLWRLYLLWLSYSAYGGNLPYSCGHATVGGKEVFIVSTLHISPRSQADVVSTISAVHPDAVMIELDEERIEDMRAPEQPTWQVLNHLVGEERRRIPSQRAFWNGARAGETITGPIVFDSANPYGLGTYSNVTDALVLLDHGGPPGVFAPLAFKTHLASHAGARAVLVKGTDPQRLPGSRLGVETLLTDLRVAQKVKSWRLPRIPALIIPGNAADELVTAAQRDPSESKVSFEVLPDTFPRRNACRRLVQESCFMLSGIWVLYYIIECFSVNSGDEFLVAEQEARRREIPCLCIDLDTDQLCNRLGAVSAPWPRNVLNVLLSWLALPRCLFRVCFPRRCDVDVIGTAFLHFVSFRLRIWLGFVISSACAGSLLGAVIYFMGRGAEGAAEAGGVVKPEDRQAFISSLLLAFEVYLMPCIYEALVASRDEAMYQQMASQVQSRPTCHRVVAVVGAAHANGILKRARTRSL